MVSEPPEPITRWIGPIPEISDAPAYASDARIVADQRSEGGGDWDGFAAPCGPAPRWGGYRPQRALPHAWGPYQTTEIPSVWSDAPDQRNALIRGWGTDPAGEEWWSHSSATPLVRRGGQWWVGCPARLCQRAVMLAAEALRAGEAPPGGLLPEEAARARELLAQDARPQAWAASGGWTPWPRHEETEAEEVVSSRGAAT